MNIVDFLELYTGRNLSLHEKLVIKRLEKIKDDDVKFLIPRRNDSSKFPLFLKIYSHKEKKKLMKCGNCKLWHTESLYENKKQIKASYKHRGKVLGACTYKGNFYPMFNYEKCPFVKERL